VHNVIGTEFDDTISGNSKANRLEGRGGRDTLEGGAGSDVLVGGDQDDTYVFAGPGDLGIDSIVDLQGSNTLDFSRMAQGVNVDLLDPYSGSYTAQKINSQLSLSMGPWFAAVDNVIGTEFDDTISGNSKANRLEGRGGRDTLLGKSGSDQLLGGTGDDTLEGGPGEDTLEGGTDNDRYRFTGAADLGSDTVIDPSNVKTGGFDSQGMETDELDFGGLAQGITFDLSKPNEVQQVNTLLKLKFSGAIDNVMGTDLDDVITGNSLSNRIEGRKGNDVLRGQAGDDFLYGGDGNDRLYGGDGTDQMYGEGDDDILVAIDGTTSDILYGGSGRNNLWFDSDPAGWGQDSVKDSYAGASGSIGCPMPSPNLHSVKSFANGADKTLDGDNLADPTDGASNGAWYVDYRNQPLFATTGPSQRDVRQGAVGDCWLLATLAANARMNPNSIHKVVVDLGDGTYAVQLGYSYYRVDADLPNEWPQGATVADFRYAHLGEQGSLWVAIVEKAYAFHRGAGTYASLKTGCADEAMNALPSTTFSESDNFGGAQDALNYIASHFNLGQAVVVAINEPGAAAPLVGPHSYSVEQVNYQTTSSGVKTPVSVVLRNPWGYDGAGNDADTKDGLVTVTGEQLVASMFGSASWDWRDSIYCAFVS
jgi:Ca2+-binding RTX toxin-like protein